MYSAMSTQNGGTCKKYSSQKEYEAVNEFWSTKGEKVKSLFKVLRKQFDVEAFQALIRAGGARENPWLPSKIGQLRFLWNRYYLAGYSCCWYWIDHVLRILLLILKTCTTGWKNARAIERGERSNLLIPKDQTSLFPNREISIGMQVNIRIHFRPLVWKQAPPHGEAKKEGGNFNQVLNRISKSVREKEPKNKPSHPRQDKRPSRLHQIRLQESSQQASLPSKKRGKFELEKMWLDPWHEICKIVAI